jgi:hypothetical protein
LQQEFLVIRKSDNPFKKPFDVFLRLGLNFFAIYNKVINLISGHAVFAPSPLLPHTPSWHKKYHVHKEDIIRRSN